MIPEILAATALTGMGVWGYFVWSARKRQNANKSATSKQVTQITNNNKKVSSWESFSIGPSLAIGAGLNFYSQHSIQWCMFSVGVGIIVASGVNHLFRRKWVTISSGLTITISMVLGWVLSPPSPLLLTAFMNPAEYAPGANIYGVIWGPKLTSIDALLENKTDSYYENVDIVFSTNISLYAVKITRSENQCNISPIPDMKTMSSTITWKDSSGMEFTLPTQSNIFKRFRITCDKFIPRSSASFMIALPKEYYDSTPAAHLNLTKPKWIVFHTAFQSDGRTGDAFKSACLIKDECADMPKSYHGE